MIRSFVWAPMADFGDVVKKLPEEIADVPVPDFAAGTEVRASTPGRFDFNEHGLLTDGYRLVSGVPKLVRLENVSVQRTSLGRARYHLVLRDGVCAEDAYHHGPWIGARNGEVGGVQTRHGPLAINMMSDVPVQATVDEPHVLISHQWQENYAHTIHETLSRWWALDGSERPLVWEISTPAQLALARLFHAGEKFVPLAAERTLFRTLYVPSFRAPFCVSRGQAEYLRGALRNDIAPGAGRKLYISRSDAASRRILNEAALLAALRPLGFETVTLASRTVAKQIALFKGADEIVMPHGAGCVNMVFSRPGVRIIELMPASYQHPMWGYWAKWLGHWHARIVCRSEGPGNDMVADIDAVLEALRS